jgi:drug/metabolite transporter (DMT)-like permease
MSPRAVGLLMATLTALCWAVLAIGLKLSLQFMSSGTIVWIRMAIAFALLFAIFAWKRRDWLSILRHPPALGLLAGVLIAANYFGFMKGIELTNASNAQIMIQSAPLSFALISIFLYKEIPTRMQAFGLLLALTGFGFFYWDQILQAVDDLERFRLGNMWILMGAATWTAFALLQKKLMKTYKPQQFNILIYLVSAILIFPTADLPELARLDVLGWLLVLFLALNTVVAYGALSEALIRIPASHVSVIISVNPLLTLAIMAYLTQTDVQWIKTEPIHWRGYLGAVLVVIGVICTIAGPGRLSPKHEPSKI